MLECPSAEASAEAETLLVLVLPMSIVHACSKIQHS
jgi:hypothetical protein